MFVSHRMVPTYKSPATGSLAALKSETLMFGTYGGYPASKKITPQKVLDIQEDLKDNPDDSATEVAKRHQVSSPIVTGVITGKRTPENPSGKKL